ncbi:MAG: YebC/PmpR family DNA-binding transcriptional regulator [Myxococcota bacterium]
MSGHSKWSTIKRKKGAADARRGKLFTKLIREMATAARMGGGDPAANPRLRLAVDKARAANMPKDTIERAIARGAGTGDGAVYEEVLYEGYGPGGTAVLVEGLTDNRKRTVGEVRHVFTKAGASLGSPGCVAHLFEKKGLIAVEAEGLDGDALLEAALEAGADDVREGDELWVVVTAPAVFEAVKGAVEAAGHHLAQAEVTLEPSTTVPLAGDDAEAMLKFAEALEDLDDVQAVHANYDIPDEIMQGLAG